MKLSGAGTLFAAMVISLASAMGVTSAARGEAPHPTPATAASDAFAAEPIRLDGAAADNPGVKSNVGMTAPSALEPGRVLLALVAVVCLILLLRWIMKKVAPGGAINGRGGVMKVLSRCTIAPKQHLLLVQVGRRLVVVGDGGSQLSAVCQITDAEEVSALLSQIGQESVSGGIRFNSIFGKARKDFDSAEGMDGGVEGEAGGLDQLPAPNRDIELPDDADASGEESGDSRQAIDPAIDATRQELAGLSEKVRGLARQLGRDSL